MTIREKLVASLLAVGTGTLRLDAAEAAAFASGVAAAHEGIQVVGQLCTAPNALASETLSAMLERWFRHLPEYAGPRRVLQRRPGRLQPAPGLDAASARVLHARVLEVCVSQRLLADEDALAVADHFAAAAAAFFALEQKCRAADRHTQRVLCSTLRAALADPYEHACSAARIFLGAREG